MTDARRLVYVDVDELVPADRNPKGHALGELDASLDRFGYTEPVVVDERTGKLVAGHGRAAALAARRDRGDAPPAGVKVKGRAWLVPVVRGWSSTDDAEAEAYLVASNRLVERGGWLDEPLAAILSDLADGAGMVGTGYDRGDLDALLARLTPEPDPTPDPEPDDRIRVPDVAVTQRLDVWELGPHRIVCADCRDPAELALAVDGRLVNLAVTSPPYADRRKYDEASGFVPIHPDGYVDWFAPVAANVADVLAPDGSWVVNIKAGAEGLDRELYVHDLVLAHVRAWGWHLADELCWERAGMPGSPATRLKNQWEPIYHFARGRWRWRPDHVRYRSALAVTYAGGGSNADRQGDPDDAWFDGQRGEGWAYPGNRLPTFAADHEAVGHAAAYPVGLPGFFVELLTDEGDVVLDPFLGSGSTVLAAARHGRVGIGTELSPRYVDVAVMRLEAALGERAMLNGRPRPPFHHEEPTT